MKHIENKKNIRKIIKKKQFIFFCLWIAIHTIGVCHLFLLSFALFLSTIWSCLELRLHSLSILLLCIKFFPLFTAEVAVSLFKWTYKWTINERCFPLISRYSVALTGPGKEVKAQSQFSSWALRIDIHRNPCHFF